MERIAFTDLDGHTIKLSHEQVAECLADMGNPEGLYLVIPHNEVPNLGSNVALRIRLTSYPKYSWFQLWQKRRKQSTLIDREVTFNFQGTQHSMPVNKRPVWVTLKHNETHIIEVL